jgi:tRNA A-37 threonylcarbamoyl transferase component Bud32
MYAREWQKRFPLGEVSASDLKIGAGLCLMILDLTTKQTVCRVGRCEMPLAPVVVETGLIAAACFRAMETHILYRSGSWIKKPQNKLNPARLLQYGLYMFPILRPTFSTGLLSEEAERLRQMHQAGISVPKVLAASDSQLVTEDVGINLETLIDRHPDQTRFYIEAAIDALVHLHAKGFVHGRPFLRDMTFKEGKVFFLDLEESPLAAMPLSVAQVRDLLLFIFSLERHGYADVHGAMLRYLVPQSGFFHRQLGRQLRLLRVLTLPLVLVPRALRGKDLRCVRGALDDAFAASQLWEQGRKQPVRTVQGGGRVSSQN